MLQLTSGSFHLTNGAGSCKFCDEPEDSHVFKCESYAYATGMLRARIDAQRQAMRHLEAMIADGDIENLRYYIKHYRTAGLMDGIQR